MEPINDCSICLEKLNKDKKICETPCCLQSFHVVCILRWITEHKTCPYCRADICKTLLFTVKFRTEKQFAEDRVIRTKRSNMLKQIKNRNRVNMHRLMPEMRTLIPADMPRLMSTSRFYIRNNIENFEGVRYVDGALPLLLYNSIQPAINPFESMIHMPENIGMMVNPLYDVVPDVDNNIDDYNYVDNYVNNYDDADDIDYSDMPELV
jgi:hypothetical protein